MRIERILKVLWIETRQEALAALLQLGVPDAVRLVIDKEGGRLNGGGTTPNVQGNRLRGFSRRSG